MSNKIQETPLELPEMKYGYNALEPVLNGQILEIHHKKHHKTYVDKYNTIIDEITPYIKDNKTDKLQAKLLDLHFNAGGHNAHALYWNNLAPKDNGGGILPDEKDPFSKEMVKTFGSFDNFKKLFVNKTVAIHGSGWCWLAMDNNT